MAKQLEATSALLFASSCVKTTAASEWKRGNRTVEGGGVEKGEEIEASLPQTGREDGKQTLKTGLLRESAKQPQRRAQGKRLGLAAGENRGNGETGKRWLAG